MTKIVKVLVVLALMVGALAMFAGPASAGHVHYILTPGTCVWDVAGGQTSISDPDHGGFHKFHNNVHIGTPGTFAVQQAGKVAIFKEGQGPGC